MSGALLAVGVTLVLVVGLSASQARLGFGAVGDPAITLGTFLVVGLVLGVGGAALFQLMAWVSRRFSATAVSAVLLAGGLALGGILVVSALFPTPMTRILVLVLVVMAGWVGASVGMLLRERRVERGSRRTFALASTLMAVGTTAVMAGWLVWPPSPAAMDGGLTGSADRPVLLGAEDPGVAGRLAVETFTYGSGTDERRPAYGANARFQTPTVNLAPLLPDFDGWEARIHRAHWGFGLEAIPLNAQVWLPVPPAGQRTERYPVVVIIPGIDPDSERSESGYAYLGELLASRGYAVVALDVNFLGGPMINARAAEMPVRAWLVLEHLRLLEEWQALGPEGIMARLDLDRIALLGHSRGGEAASVAALLNTMGRYPSDPSIPLSFGFGIQAVVALAPTDQYFRPGGRPTSLTDLSYLVLHGSHDGDVLSFLGSGQYQRVRIPDGSPAFKSSIYVVGANHSNFSSSRTGSDHPGVLGLLLDRSRLLSPAQQRQVTASLTSAFLDAALKDEVPYRSFLRDPRAGGSWLPPVDLVTRFEDGRTLHVATFETDVDPGSATLEGVRLLGRNLAQWNEETLRLRDLRGASLENSVVRLGWTERSAARGEPSFELIFEDDAPPEARHTAASLVFSLGSPSPSAGPADLSIELESDDGVRVRLPLSNFGPVPTPEFPQIWRIRAMDALMVRGMEQVLQDYRVPLATFEIVEPEFRLDRLAVVRFVFDQAPRGTVLLDDVGFRIPPESGAIVQ